MPAPPTTTTSSSPFLKLPPELRNIIYTHIFDDLTITPCPCIASDGHCRYCIFYSPQQQASSPAPQRQVPFHNGTGLTHTCRQIRAETRLLPFKYARYQVKCLEHFARWYADLDGELRAVVWGRLEGWQRGELEGLRV